eukprot:10795-Heterococcus_DN1.PRE.1
MAPPRAALLALKLLLLTDTTVLVHSSVALKGAAPHSSRAPRGHRQCAVASSSIVVYAAVREAHISQAAYHRAVLPSVAVELAESEVQLCLGLAVDRPARVVAVVVQELAAVHSQSDAYEGKDGAPVVKG